MSAVDALLLDGFGSDGLCRRCSRTQAQHGRLSCGRINAIEARQERDRMRGAWWGRLVAQTRRPDRARA